jgi:hypothetical protein
MNAKLEEFVIMQFLWSAQRDAVEIHSRLVQAFQRDVYTFSSVYDLIRAFKTGRTSVLHADRAERPRLDYIDSKILSLDTENEFHNVRAIAQERGISLSKMPDRWVNVLGLVARCAMGTPFAYRLTHGPGN